MRKLFFSIGVVGAMFLISSCSSSKKALTAGSLNGEWSIIEVDGQRITPATQQHTPFIGFDYAQKRIYGNSGCNRMMGTFSIDSLKPGMINFGPVAGTRMACPDMTVEQKVLAALEGVRAYELVDCNNNTTDSCKISLRDSNGRQLILIERRNASTSTADLSALSGEWNISTVNGANLNNPHNQPFIGFNLDENRIYGNASCNSLNGPIKQETNKVRSLEFGPIAATMMMCPSMESERTIMEALENVKSYNILGNGNLAFYNADGTELMTLVRR